MTYNGMNWERKRYEGSTGTAVAEAECSKEGAFTAVAVQRFEWVIPPGEDFAEVKTIGEGEYVCINESRNLGQEVKVSRISSSGQVFFEAVVQPRGGGHRIKDYNRGDTIRIEPSVSNHPAAGFVDLGIF